MLHEVLLALSGHPSPLFTGGKNGLLDSHSNDHDSTTLLSKSERDLLDSIGRLSELHRKLRQHLEEILSSHRSTVCRAVANSARQTHLARFQKKVLDVERNILTRDPSLVGAYDIVPLASVVSQFDDWQRRMHWYWDLACLIDPTENKNRGEMVYGASGAAVIDWLRSEARTGFPDIEEAAVELTRVAEAAWMRQVASWILHGKLPAMGADDFFVRSEGSSDEQPEVFRKDGTLLPKHVTSPTAASILFIGKSLNQVRHYEQQSHVRLSQEGNTNRSAQLTSSHMKQLASLSLPIVPTQLSRAVAAIRLSLSQNVLQRLLPLDDTLLVLACMRRYFLLGDGEFAMALISEAENRLQSRWESMGKLLQQDPVKALQGLSIKDAELNQTLSQTWKVLAARDDEEESSVLDFARKNTTFSAPSRTPPRPSTADSVTFAAPKISSIAFNDLLFPNPSKLSLTVTPPLDLFISTREIETYSSISAYLVSIRRAHLRLSDIWRRSSARRTYPAPPAGNKIATDSRRRVLVEARSRAAVRSIATRKVWATCSAAIFLLSETAGYLEGEIIDSSWERFEAWVKEPAVSDTIQESGTLPDADANANPQLAQRDPETLAAGHRAFLATLTNALLLTDVPYTRDLRSLLGNIDQLIALFVRLLEVQQKLDLEWEAGVDSGHVEQEEQKVALELDRARKKVDSDLKSVVGRLRQLDQERIGAGRYLDLGAADTGGFEPWKGGGVDRLLMKLEFGRVREEGFDIV